MSSKSLFQKVLLCLVTSLVVGATYLRIVSRFLDFIPAPVRLWTAIAMPVALLIYAFVWHRKEKHGSIDSQKVNARWIGALRYTIAFDLVMFGLQKIFHLQFITPMGMLDEPFSNLSSEWLTWSYFGHSYGFAVTIGLSQIIGSMLLLFSRTRLLAVIVLMPVMLNIIFIDFFYELQPGVLAHALILFSGLIYLLLMDYNRLVLFFLRHTDNVSVRSSNAIKVAGRVSVLIIPLLLIYRVGSPDEHPELTGKYAVIDMKVNGKPMLATTCSDSLLTVVYFDTGNDCVFEFNDQKRRTFGIYDLDESQGTINTVWHYPPRVKSEAFNGKLKMKSDGQVELSGVMRNDSLQVTLKLLHRKWITD